MGSTNVVFNEASAPTWVAVQTPAVPLHPWAIEAPAIPPCIRRGQWVSSDGERLTLGASALSVRDAHIDELRISPYTREEAERAVSFLPLIERFLAEETRRRPTDPFADPFQSQIDAILERWHATGDPAVLLDLVGLGIGSTPSGDDVLVGIFVGLAVFSGISQLAQGTLAELRQQLRNERPLMQTSSASRQMLAAATGTSFPEPLCVLDQALKQPEASDRTDAATKRVQDLGGTSGLNMLGGLLASIRADHIHR